MPPPPPKRPTIPPLWYVTAALIGMLLVQLLLAPGQPRQAIPYSTFEGYLKSGKIAEVTVTDHQIQGRLKSPTVEGKSLFVVNRVAPELAGGVAK
jgi:cell division protease FtsH